MPETRRSPGGTTGATPESATTTAATTILNGTGRQMTAVGPVPGVEDLFIGALLYSTAAEVTLVARFIEPGDLDEPVNTVLASIKSLAGRGLPPSPDLVKDDLHRRGKLTRSTATWLISAATSGACSSAAHGYAAAVLAAVFRRQAEGFGHALIQAAPSASESSVAVLAENAAARIRYVHGRLVELRGGVDD